MKKQHNRLAWFISALGTILAILIGFCMMFVLPIVMCIINLRAGQLTFGQIVITVALVFCASTVGGTIWCAFDILATHVKNEPRDD